MERKVKQNERLTLAQKNAKNKTWYEEQADMLDTSHHTSLRGAGDISEYRRMKVNYDLFNNILHTEDFEYVCKPYGAEVGELPASMVNRDISSGKIKVMLGMEMARPFSYKVLATNPEATTRKEQEEFGKIREFVTSSILQPIRIKVEQKYQEQLQNKELDENQIKQIQQSIEEETKAMTPEEVSKYMQREHQDPAEVLSHQLLEYLIKKCNIKKKFNDAFKHAMLSAKSLMYVGIMNGEPDAWVVNPLRFTCDKTSDAQFVEDSEWAVYEHRMMPSDVIKYFGDELTDKEIDKIYSDYSHYKADRVRESLFTFDETLDDEANTIRVLHCVWKSLKKIGFLTYLDEDEEEQERVVHESYRLNEGAGDIEINWIWIPEVYQTWKINTDIYVKKGPVEGQFKDLDNLYYCKLPYYGAIHDNMNSQETSLMDRLKVYQYYYNIVMYRLELLLASDEGKKVMMNINAIPDNADIDVEKWTYFFKSSPFMWYDPEEEGSGYSDVNTMAKVIDLSLASDIGKYVEFALYLEQQSGKAVGITDAVEGQIGPHEAVRNTQQGLTQSSRILEPYFDLHNHFKKNVLQALLETAKVAYSGSNKKKLSYVLDDMSIRTLNMDTGLLDNSTLGLFVADSSKAQETKDLIKDLTHAAMQNQKIEMSDVFATLRQEGSVEAEEILKVAEQKRRDNENAMREKELASNERLKEMENVEKEKEHGREKELIVLKETERRKTEVQKAALTGMSFNPDADSDKDGVNDFLEIAKHGVDAEVKRSEQQIKKEELEFKKSDAKEKNSIARDKIKSDNKKNSQKTTTK